MANEIARRLRHNETTAEQRLWREIRQLRRQGYHFRRQAPIDHYIVDFVCFSQRLIVEIDGYQHFEPAGVQRDHARDAHLTWRGFKVVRFSNSDVADNVEGVMEAILLDLGALNRSD